MQKKIQVMLIEDSPGYRKVIELALKDLPDVELNSQFGTSEIALRNLQTGSGKTPVDLILLDLSLPGMDGLDALPYIKKYAPQVKVIILTQSDREKDVLRAIQVGASGYLLKSSTVSQIMEGIRTVMNGGASLDAGVARFILSSLQTRLPDNDEETSLSTRELEILTLLAQGFLKKEIGDRPKSKCRTK